MRLEKKGTHRGFEYAILVMPMGHRCGYVKLPQNHPWYKKNPDNIETNVHGGLTFASLINNNEHPILKKGYWIGFDCIHAFDMPDPDEMSKEFFNKGGYKIAKAFQCLQNSKIRNKNYVESQCRNLCEECFQQNDSF